LTDLEFLERLRHELATGAAWSDIAGVGTAADEPDLFGNELRVYPVAADPAKRRVSAFRLLCEWEVRPRRAFPRRPTPRPPPTSP
jgi:hypothetical protein